VGLIQEDDNFLRVISWFNGSIYEIWYDKKEETIEIIDKAHFLGKGICFFAGSRYEWGLNEYFVIGNYNSESLISPSGYLVLADMDSADLINYEGSFSFSRFIFFQVTNSLGYYYYRNKTGEILIQEVRIDGKELNEASSFKYPFTYERAWIWFQSENQIPYLMMLHSYSLNQVNSDVHLVNLLNNHVFRGKTHYRLPIGIQEYSSNLIAIIGHFNFAIMNESTGKIISSGPTNFHKFSTITKSTNNVIDLSILVIVLFLGISRKRKRRGKL
jgi:hypothetical protein